MSRKPFATSSRIVAITAAVLLGPTIGQEALADGRAVSQLRRTVEDSERSASGVVTLQNLNGKQMLDVRIAGLGAESFKIYITTNLIAGSFNTNDFVFSVTPLERTNVKKGTWLRKLTEVGTAPAAIPFIDDVDELANRQVVIARPGPDILVNITNVVDCVTINPGETNETVNCHTNIITGLPLFDPGVTGTVSSVLWAPVPDFLLSTGTANYTIKVDLELPSPGVPPTDKAKGRLTLRFNNSRGQSVLDVRAKGLIPGQVYSVWIGDSPAPSILVKAGDMELKKDGASAQFIRDTRFGDPLPQQAPFLSDLSGRPIAILDEFEEPYLVGIIP